LGILGVENITPEILFEKKAVSRKGKPVKILGSGEINTAITVKAHAFSKTAMEKIEKAGGKIEIIGKKEKLKAKKEVVSDAGSGEESDTD
jgi:ribosomal protein L15